jgi:hypothetical protein
VGYELLTADPNFTGVSHLWTGMLKLHYWFFETNFGSRFYNKKAKNEGFRIQPLKEENHLILNSPVTEVTDVDLTFFLDYLSLQKIIIV